MTALVAALPPLQISADESLDDHGSGGDIDKLGMNPVLLKGANLFRHPKAGGHGSDTGIAQSDSRLSSPRRR